MRWETMFDQIRFFFRPTPPPGLKEYVEGHRLEHEEIQHELAQADEITSQHSARLDWMEERLQRLKAEVAARRPRVEKET